MKNLAEFHDYLNDVLIVTTYCDYDLSRSLMDYEAPANTIVHTDELKNLINNVIGEDKAGEFNYVK